jgi:hypothetical protein
MVPLAQRLNLRDPNLSLEFVGSSSWTDANNLEAIGRLGDPAHPRQVGSIYTGEVTADAMDLNELRSVPP